MLLNDKQTIVLLCIRERKSIVEISKIIDRSQKTVQNIIEELARLGLLANTFGPKGGGKTRGRHLTPSGINVLKSAGHKEIK
jgi:predicted transcriptional regulator